MGNDLAQADAVNTALANQRGCAAHDAVTGRLLLAAPSVRGVSCWASMRTAYPGAMTLSSPFDNVPSSMTVVIAAQAIVAPRSEEQAIWRQQR